VSSGPDSRPRQVATGVGDDGTPLCVDLDGTLVRSDTLIESTLLLVRQRPSRLPLLPWWLLRGRPFLKRRLAESVEIDPASLPYNEELLDLLNAERQRGRRLILVTASHARTARRIADHLGLFDEVLATDGATNLKGRTKRDALIRRFGQGRFDYAGNSTADLEVWPAARLALAVNASSRVLRRLGERTSRVLDRPQRSGLADLIDAVRVRQWVKNLLVFLPTLLAHRYLDASPMLRSAAAFVSFSLGASAIYLLNDLLDLDADRAHPLKRHRPFASGSLGLQTGIVAFPLLVVGSLAIGVLLGPAYVTCVLGYLVLTTLYSMWLKQVALVDVLILAGLYSLRILAGSAASGVIVSEWLLAFSMFLFLSLGAVKRYAELRRAAAGGVHVPIRGRGYTTEDLGVILPMGLSSGFLAVLVLALYVTSDAVIVWYRHPNLLWLICPLLLYWVSRVWLLAQRGQMSEDPVLFAVSDRVTWLVLAACAAVVLVARMGRW